LGSDNETPTKANIPAWALNPDYTVHATTSKPDDSQYRAIFDIFNKSDATARKDSASSHKSITDVAQSTPQQQQHQPPSSPRAQSEPPKAKKNSSTTRL
jgi:hypothetical protein